MFCNGIDIGHTLGIFLHEDQGQLVRIVAIVGIVDVIGFQGQAFLVFLAQELISAVFDDFIEAVIIRAFQFDDLFPPFAPGQGSPAGIGREGRRTQGILDFLRRDPFFRIRDVPDQELLVPVDVEALAFHVDLGVAMRARVEK